MTTEPSKPSTPDDEHANPNDVPAEPQDTQDTPEDADAEEETTARKPTIEIAIDQDEHWYWVLWSENGRPLATSITPYKRYHDARRAVENTKALFANAAITRPA